MKNDLKTLIKTTLNNDICNVQSLDVANDRNKVLKELMKTLEPLVISHNCKENCHEFCWNELCRCKCHTMTPKEFKKLIKL